MEMQLTSSASQTGDGDISTLTYKTGDEEVVVTNPDLPWEMIVEVAAETDFSFSASATTKNGSLTISYSGQGVWAKILGSDFCSS